LSLGLGLSFTYLHKEFQEKLFKLTDQNIQFAYGLGQGIGLRLYMPSDLQIEIFKRPEQNSQFMRGLGIGFGKNVTIC
jgi:hypothetical protein